MAGRKQQPKPKVICIGYRDNVLDPEPQQCPLSSIVRYWIDNDNWVEVSVGDRGIELRSNLGQMIVEPRGGNAIEVYPKGHWQ